MRYLIFLLVLASACFAALSPQEFVKTLPNRLNPDPAKQGVTYVVTPQQRAIDAASVQFDSPNSFRHHGFQTPPASGGYTLRAKTAAKKSLPGRSRFSQVADQFQ